MCDSLVVKMSHLVATACQDGTFRQGESYRHVHVRVLGYGAALGREGLGRENCVYM